MPWVAAGAGVGVGPRAMRRSNMASSVVGVTGRGYDATASAQGDGDGSGDVVAEVRRSIGGLDAEPYQSRIADEVAASVGARRSGMVVAPTGSGKGWLVALAVEDCVRAALPVLVLQPSIDLLRQNMAVMRKVGNLSDVTFGLFAAKGERTDDVGPVARDTLSTGVATATFMSLTNKRREPWLAEALAEFGRAGGVVVVDEGQGAAAEGLGEVLSMARAAGAIGIGLSATPVRTDGQDPMASFGVEPGRSVIAVAEHREVLRTGRTVPTRFSLAGRELARRLGAEGMTSLDDVYEELVSQGRSLEQASEETFGRLFKARASDAERALGAVLTGCVADVWLSRCADRALAMIHCDGVAMARAVMAEVAGRRLPSSHPRAGRHPSVGYVDAKGFAVFRDGEPVDAKALGWRKGEARRELIAAARRGDFDVLVNVTALGVGTDISCVDLNVMATYRTGIAMTKQRSGRGERSYPGKADQLFVDLGSSVVRHYGDLMAIAAGDEASADPFVRDLDPRIRDQFKQWFDGDPDLADAVRALRDDRSLVGAEREEPEDLGDPVGADVPATALPELVPLGGAAWAAGSKRVERGSGAFVGKVALVLDLVGLGYLRPESNVATHLCLVRDVAGFGFGRGFCADLEGARRYLAAAGVRRAPAEAAPRTASERQLGMVRSLGSEARSTMGRRLRPPAGPVDKATASTVIDALTMARDAPGEVLAALGGRALGTPGLDHPVAQVVIDAFRRVPAGRVAAIADYARLCAATSPTGRGPAIVAADRAERADVAAAFGVRLSEVGDLGAATSTTRGREETRRAWLAGRVGAYTGRGGDPADWMRRRLGLRVGSDASRRREASLATALGRLPTLRVTRHEGRFATVAGGPDLARLAAAVGPRWADGAVPVEARGLAILGEAVMRLPEEVGSSELEAALRAAPRGAKALAACADGGGRLVVDRRTARVVVLSDPPADQERTVGVLLEWTDAVFRDATRRETERRLSDWRSRREPGRQPTLLDARGIDDVVMD